MKTYEKTIGDLTVHASEPCPRFIDIRYKFGNQVIRTLTMQEVRDLQYMLAEVLRLPDDDDED